MLVIILSSCAQVNQSEKITCEKSGGKYENGFTETKGTYWYCVCPNGKYSTPNNECKDINNEAINKCKGISTTNVSCDDVEGRCLCIWNQQKRNEIPYWKLMSENCNCKCSSEICNCVCNTEV